MVNAQEWINDNHSNKNEVKRIKLDVLLDEIEDIDGGSLIIEDYPNLEELVIDGSWLKSSLDKLTIKNCPKLKDINCFGNESTDIDFSCPNLIKLGLHDFNFTNIDLSHFPQLTYFWLSRSKLTSIDFLTTLPQHDKLKELKLSNNQIQSTNLDFLRPFINLVLLDISGNKLTNIDFLNQLSNPEKLEELCISNNLIEPTTLEFLRPFINLKTSLLGTDWRDYEERKKNNLFYGSLKPLQNLTKLEALCIAGTDIDSGLEYLPESLVKRSEYLVNQGSDTNSNNAPDCQTIRPDAKVQVIQDQLRPFDYDLTAWRLANTFVNSADKISQLEAKIKETEAKLNNTRQNESDKTKKIERLESKLNLLEETKKNLEQENNSLKDQLTQLKQAQADLTNKLKDHDQTIAESQHQLTALQDQLDQTQQRYLKTEETLKLFKLGNGLIKQQLKAKEAELIKLREQTSQSTATLRKEIESLKTQLETAESQDHQLADLNQQLTALALSTGLLTQQCENLTTKLTTAEQKAQHKQLELEIKENLLKDKDNNLSQQEQQIKNYQALLRKSEENLSKSQQIIQQKSDQLDQLEKEKSNLADLLAQAEEKISQLESSLLTANNQIQELELKIKDLEANNPHSTELVKLKQELTQLKSSSQSELNSLKNQLQQAQLSEERLQQQLHALTSKLAQEQETIPNNSFWTQVKTPLFYGLGILLIIFVINYLRSKVKH
jgi:DNA repair exonuclease SbcCD ATPase subunit